MFEIIRTFSNMFGKSEHIYDKIRIFWKFSLPDPLPGVIRCISLSSPWGRAGGHDDLQGPRERRQIAKHNAYRACSVLHVVSCQDRQEAGRTA